MEQNQKPNKDTQEIADKYIFPADGKDYSDFKQMENLLNKIAKGVRERYAEIFNLWLEGGQDEDDFADFVLRAIYTDMDVIPASWGES